jgi:hypothetical protein
VSDEEAGHTAGEKKEETFEVWGERSGVTSWRASRYESASTSKNRGAAREKEEEAVEGGARAGAVETKASGKKVCALACGK